MDRKQLDELFYQAIETELGGEQIYLAAIDCAVNDDLREEWEGYLDETRNHQRILRDVFEAAELDIERDTPGCDVLWHKATGLIEAMAIARDEGGPGTAQLVAAECVVEAESKDHRNWELIGLMAEHVEGALGTAMADAYGEVAEEEAEHLFHTMDGRANSGSSHWVFPRPCLPPKRRSMSRPRSARAGQPRRAMSMSTERPSHSVGCA